MSITNTIFIEVSGYDRDRAPCNFGRILNQRLSDIKAAGEVDVVAIKYNVREDATAKEIYTALICTRAKPEFLTDENLPINSIGREIWDMFKSVGEVTAFVLTIGILYGAWKLFS